MRVVPIAATQLRVPNHMETGFKGSVELPLPAHADELAEIAGRTCYQSWDRPNPKTATNKGYLDNILAQGHYSVLEHASVSFYVEGVSRSLLTELERHRFLSFSVISQRYVYVNADEFVTPPLLDGNETLTYLNWGDSGTVEELFHQAVQDSHDAYGAIADALQRDGNPKKKALEAARAVLPNATEVKMVVTGNIRCWRDVIGKRYHEAADAEIREFATEILRHLRFFAPNSVQDIPEVPYV